MLAAESETILYVSSHGPFEKGKDIITRTGAGEIRAYQLKAGNVGLSEWRAIYGEIVNLVELAIEIPGTPPITEFVPYLVTNGELTDPVFEQVRVANVTWQNRGIDKNLHVVQKGELFERFRASHGSYLPHELADFRTFLELILHDGAAPAEKEKASGLIEHVLPSKPEDESSLNIARAASSIVLLAAYISGPAVLAANHWSVFEYWVLTASYVLYLAEKSNKAELDCQVSFELCEIAAEGALRALAEECAGRSDFVQGLPLIDGHTYRSRITVLAGLLSAWDLSLRILHKSRSKTGFIQSFLTARLKEAAMWGESAVPYLFLAALEAEQDCRPDVAEGIAIQLVREISTANGASAEGRGHALTSLREQRIEIQRQRQNNYASLLEKLASFVRNPDKETDNFTKVHLYSWVVGSAEVVESTTEFMKKPSRDSLTKLLRAMRKDVGLPETTASLDQKVLGPVKPEAPAGALEA